MNGLNSIGKGIAILGVWFGGALMIYGINGMIAIEWLRKSMRIPKEVLPPSNVNLYFGSALSIAIVLLVFYTTLAILKRWDKNA